MAIRNDNLGGSNFFDGEVLDAVDLNDTFNAVASKGIDSTVTNLTYSTNSTITDSFISCDNFTINSGVTVATTLPRDGLIIFCKGTFTIEGTLDLTSTGVNRPDEQTNTGVVSGTIPENGFFSRGGASGETGVYDDNKPPVLKNLFERTLTDVKSESMMAYLKSVFPGSLQSVVLPEIYVSNFAGGAGTNGGIRTLGSTARHSQGGGGGPGILVIANSIVISGSIISTGQDGATGARISGSDSAYGGGAGGGSGGPILLYANSMNLSGTISSVGGNGSNAFNAGFVSGDLDGGDGGNGGVIALYYATLSGSYTTNVLGGSGGSGVLTGVSGSSGTAGDVILVQFGN